MSSMLFDCVPESHYFTPNLHIIFVKKGTPQGPDDLVSPRRHTSKNELAQEVPTVSIPYRDINVKHVV